MINLYKLHIHIIYIELAAQKNTQKFDEDLRVKYNSRCVDSRRLNDISTRVVA